MAEVRIFDQARPDAEAVFATRTAVSVPAFRIVSVLTPVPTSN
jgi:hypothetical protein